MSIFKKPKRNIRKRDIGSNDENEEENDFKEDGDSAELKKSLPVKSSEPKSKKDKKKQSVLSFEEEWNEGTESFYLLTHLEIRSVDGKVDTIGRFLPKTHVKIWNCSLVCMI